MSEPALRTTATRRDVLKSGAFFSGALVIAFALRAERATAQSSSAAQNPTEKTPANASSSSGAHAAEGAPFAPNAWLRIGADDSVTVLVDRSELGQGISTALPMLVAEELGADWTKVRFEFAPAAPEYANPILHAQGTGGSTSIRAAWKPLRTAAAAAREMLTEAAAKNWSVDRGECAVRGGRVVHAKSGRSASFGSLALSASSLPVPENPALGPAGSYALVGKPTKRLDTPAKCNGSARFGIDVRLPGMKYAVVARCPVFGGRVRSHDDSRAKSSSGVRAVIPISSGVAVVADTSWQAMKARDLLALECDEGANADLSDDTIRALYLDAAKKTGAIARDDGDAHGALSSAADLVEASYEVPFMAHATMEPMNCTADVRADGCDVHVPTQFQTTTQSTAAKICGLSIEKVRVHTTFCGGGFGRRSEIDFVTEAVEISRAMKAPVQVVWTRADDVQHDVYRPATYTELAAALDRYKQPQAFWARIVGPSIFGRVMPGNVKDGIDRTSVEGLKDLPYAFPNVRVEYVRQETGVPVGFWRSVGHSQNGFILESFIDEIAHAAGKDPLEFRRGLLAEKPRHRGVLDAVASAAGWGRKMPERTALGIAMLESYESYVAEVAEVAVGADGLYRVEHVWCAIDCGQNVNPDTIEAQMQSGIAWGLSMLKGRVTIHAGRAQQSNFHDYPVLRMEEMPKVDVTIVKSGEAPGGVGETAVPPLAPAVANAIFAASGVRVRNLPIVRESLERG
jgi:isoquinoline 1-oxidoreductase beta subunit